jgi:hypothetical protein
MVLARLSMTYLIANDDEGRWDADRAAFFAETEQRSWENLGWDPWCVATHPDPVAAYPHRTTATARWARSILLIAALSALSWAVVMAIVIAALSTL